jgi:anti-anti-sigma regulatory factor
MPLNSSVRESGEIIITSGERLTIENAADFSQLIRDALDAASVVNVEFDPTVEIDITGIQILCSACRSAAQAGKLFSHHGSLPRTLIDIISVCGAGRHAICKHNNNSNCIWFGGAN